MEREQPGIDLPVRLSPAMRKWAERLGAGYTIEARMRRGRYGRAEWGPALFNPEGQFVQNVRRDTVKRLMRLGVLGVARMVAGVDAEDEVGDG